MVTKKTKKSLEDKNYIDKTYLVNDDNNSNNDNLSFIGDNLFYLSRRLNSIENSIIYTGLSLKWNVLFALSIILATINSHMSRGPVDDIFGYFYLILGLISLLSSFNCSIIANKERER